MAGAQPAARIVILFETMQLKFETQVIKNVAVIRCAGRISFGPEVEALQAEVDKHTKIAGTDIYSVNQVLVQLAETNYIDSSGLGALVRLLGKLRAAGGGLKICQPSSTVRKTFEITNLEVLFPIYESEAQAIQAFWDGSHDTRQDYGQSKTRIVCVDTSSDLLAGLNALLSSAGYEVFTTRYVGEAATLVKATRPDAVICGASVMSVSTGPAAVEKFSQIGWTRVLHLPPDFHITEAGQAGQELLAKVRSLVAN